MAHVVRALGASFIFALCALALVPLASASNDLYKFTSRAATEAALRTQFVALERARTGVRYRVNSIACAKGSVTTGYCAIVATSKQGTEPFALKIACPDTRWVGCTVRVTAWPS